MPMYPVSESLLPNFNLRINLQAAQDIISGLDNLIDEYTNEQDLESLMNTRALILSQLGGQGVNFTE
jgi:hypothetical protein